MEIKKMNLLAALLVCMASCSDDEQVGVNAPAADGETTVFRIETHAEMGNYSPATSRGITPPAITADNFRILAFKESPDNGKFLYEQDVPTEQLTYANNVLSGTARLPIGKYKFVPTYGFVTGGGFSLPEFVSRNTELTNTLNITHNTVDASSVFFLGKDPVEKLQTYALGISPTPNENVSLSMSRAVSRVDILFIQVKEENGVKVEVSDSTDVFGASELAGIDLQFTGLNKNINLSGNKVTNDNTSLFNPAYSITDLGNAVTKGNSETDTQVGTDGYLSYDNIQAEHIKQGSAHVHGVYVLPFGEVANDTRLNLTLTNKRGDVRNITVKDPLPLERNKVTLVKIYVLSGTVFNTDVKFDVIVDTAWLGANTVEGEIN